jgi:hypothetical protein
LGTLYFELSFDYLGGRINYTLSRDLDRKLWVSQIKRSFLPAGSYSIKLYSDDLASENLPNKFRIETKSVKASDVITLELASGGGVAGILRAE